MNNGIIWLLLFIFYFITPAYTIDNDKHPLHFSAAWNKILQEKGDSLIKKALAKENLGKKNINSATIGVVTLTTPDRANFTTITHGKLRKYCADWGYKYHVYNTNLDTTRFAAWSKVVALQEVMTKNPEYTWVVWIDDDILITNPRIRIEDFIESFGEAADLIISQDVGTRFCWLLNTGIMIIRNNEFMQNFLKDVWTIGKIKNYCEAGKSYYDQAAIVDCLEEIPEYAARTISLPLGILQSMLHPVWQKDSKTAWRYGVFASHAAGMNNNVRFDILNKLSEQGDLANCYPGKSIYAQKNTIVEKEIVIVSASRNNKNNFKENLDSTLNQVYANYSIIWIDDASEDGTQQLVEAYLKQYDVHNRVTFIKNIQRCGATENFYRAIHRCNDNAIIVMVDGDDKLAHANVLQVINNAYQDPAVWLTYGSLKPRNEAWWNRAYWTAVPDDIIKNNGIRDYKWLTDHLKTFYAWLYKKINTQDLLYKGNFYPVASDCAMMFPMVEMAGVHSKFISEILYIYNDTLPTNDHKVHKDLVPECINVIRASRRYLPLAAKPIICAQ